MIVDSTGEVMRN